MTYVAAQKGWDGIALVTLITFAWASDFLIHGSGSIAKRWFTHEGIDIEHKNFEFTGRFALMGAIQIFKKNPVEVWMDGILRPSTRREAWLARLRGVHEDVALKLSEACLSPSDKAWVDRNVYLSQQGAEVIRFEFSKMPVAADL